MRVGKTTVDPTWTPEQARRLDVVMRAIVDALSGLTVADNVAGKTFVFTWNTDLAPLAFEWAVGSKVAAPRFVAALKATAADGTIVSLPPVTWAYLGGMVQVSAIGSLASSTDYEVELLMVEG
jgi:hypothetical protein